MRMWILVLAVFAIVGGRPCCCTPALNIASGGYAERLILKPLNHSSLLASFNFRSNTSRAAFDAQNFRYIPRALGQILQHARTRELHLRFSSGRWDTVSWGDRPWGGSREGGTGVELWAWVEATDEVDAKSRWLTLTNALSGLFCASLNFVDATRTIRPAFAFQAEGEHAGVRSEDLHLLHGSLPNEVVCTENLTPFLKLLPCKGKAGVSSLLDGHKLFDASWQTMAIDVRPIWNASEEYVEMEQTIDMILDVERAKRLRVKPYSQMKDSCYPIENARSPGFSVSQIFGRPIGGACPMAQVDLGHHASLCIDDPSEQWPITVTKGHLNESYVADKMTCMSLLGEVDVDISFGESIATDDHLDHHGSVQVERTLTGQGQQYGGLQAVFHNPSSSGSARFVYLESLPWFMKPYFHTLRTLLTSEENVHSCGMDNPIIQMYYRPAVDRIRSSHMEMMLHIPPLCKVELSYEFEKSILRYAEYPPDANRGFDVPPAIIRILSDGVSDGNMKWKNLPMSLRTTSLLLYLPTPDFSMPYNTIILTSTVIALAFGSIYNILVRRFVAADEVKRSKSLKALMEGKLALLKTRFRSKSKTKSE